MEDSGIHEHVADSQSQQQPLTKPQTDRQTDKQSNKQTDKQSNKQSKKQLVELQKQNEILETALEEQMFQSLNLQKEIDKFKV